LPLVRCERASRECVTVSNDKDAILTNKLLRTGSLALPIGLYLGWNWTQGTLLGFDVSGLAQAGWLHPHLLARPQWLTGGAFGPEASVFSVVVDLAAIALLWRWKGVAPRSRQIQLPVAEAA
jgi:hypothetical protein